MLVLDHLKKLTSFKLLWTEQAEMLASGIVTVTEEENSDEPEGAEGERSCS